jgi:Protein of unknown function (DUF4235)
MVRRNDLIWKATAMAAGAASGAVTRRALQGLWRAVKGDEPPTNPAGRHDDPPPVPTRRAGVLSVAFVSHHVHPARSDADPRSAA